MADFLFVFEKNVAGKLPATYFLSYSWKSPPKATWASSLVSGASPIL